MQTTVIMCACTRTHATGFKGCEPGHLQRFLRALLLTCPACGTCGAPKHSGIFAKKYFSIFLQNLLEVGLGMLCSSILILGVASDGYYPKPPLFFKPGLFVRIGITPTPFLSVSPLRNTHRRSWQKLLHSGRHVHRAFWRILHFFWMGARGTPLPMSMRSSLFPAVSLIFDRSLKQRAEEREQTTQPHPDRTQPFSLSRPILLPALSLWQMPPTDCSEDAGAVCTSMSW